MPITYSANTEASSARNGQASLRSLDDLDGRTRAARQARHLIEALEDDMMAASGAASLTAAQSQLIRRAAMLAAIAEDGEARWLSGKSVDLTVHGTLVDRLRRILESLGLNRSLKPQGCDVTARVIAHIAGEAP